MSPESIKPAHIDIYPEGFPPSVHYRYHEEHCELLGKRRQQISNCLGEEFCHLLEQEESFLPELSQSLFQQVEEVMEGYQKNKNLVIKGPESEKVAALILRLSPRRQIIGVNLNLEEELEGVEQIYQRLGSQVGLPECSSLIELRGKIWAERRDTAIVLLGINRLSEEEQEELLESMEEDYILQETLRISTISGP